MLMLTRDTNWYLSPRNLKSYRDAAICVVFYGQLEGERDAGLIKSRHWEKEAHSCSKDEVTKRHKRETIFLGSYWRLGNMQPDQDTVSNRVEYDTGPQEAIFLLGTY